MNFLKNEKSAYLRQHANNPIHWRVWGQDALDQAKQESKLVFLSVGYSTCHWCHVMERESFEDPAVAQVLNKDFVSIKVDREERPDVDQIYMDALVGMTGHGGWPMTVICTPEGDPVFTGTYFPKTRLIVLLEKIQEAWIHERSQVLKTGSEVRQWLQSDLSDSISELPLSMDAVGGEYLRRFEGAFDGKYGGRRGAPKFPPAYDLRLLLQFYYLQKEPQILDWVTKTLDEMSRRGIYDHLGGGFHRYSTDEKWCVPHFEKMLYDQASLGWVYTEAFQLTSNPDYRQVVEQTLEYVLRDLKSPQGGFYSAEDADSEGREGLFYVWKFSELEEILNTHELEVLCSTFEVSESGNFEDQTNILTLKSDICISQYSAELKGVLQKLFEVRKKRIRPLRDNKVLTSWNALMIKTLAKAAQVFENQIYLDSAQEAAEFIFTQLVDSKGFLLRRWVEGESKYEAGLEDYAFLIDASLELYQADFDSKWLNRAMTLQKTQDQLFWDPKKGGYFLTDGADPTLIRRGKEYSENVIPSGNSVSALNLLRLGTCISKTEYFESLRKLLQSVPERFWQHPGAIPVLLQVADLQQRGLREIKITTQAGLDLDPQIRAFISRVQKIYHPGQIFSVSSQEVGAPTIQICENQTCQPPRTDFERVVSDLIGSL